LILCTQPQPEIYSIRTLKHYASASANGKIGFHVTESK